VVLAAAFACAIATATAADADSAWQKRIEAGRSYWAFQAPEDSHPRPSKSSWVRTDIDAFILAALQEKELTPSPELNHEKLLRRVYLDLTGLPPTLEEADTFLNDASARAYEELVERLLASPHYGERWALKWLDVVRYADTNGFEGDADRPDAWRYRDYVAASFSDDKPYDRFIQEQIAGDEMFPGDPAALIALGFNRAGPRHVVGGNQDKEETRQELLTEMTAGVASAFLGLTVQCARCHDHKFDPIAHADYYRLQAFFTPAELREPTIASAAEVRAYEQAEKAYQARLEPIKDELKQIEKPYYDQVLAANKAKLEPHFRAALDVPEERRDEEQKRLAKEAEGQIKPPWYDVLALIPEDVKTQRAAIRARMHALGFEKPHPPATAFSLGSMEEAPPTHILKIGDYRYKLDRVEPGFLSVLSDFGIELPAGPSGLRTALARWLTAPEHPLTARVMANRVWELRMGRGLVPDPNNFGLLGGGLSHPELLDFLARKLVDFGWSIKALDRMIVLSAVYRQSAEIDPEKAKIDADNKLYWRANRLRLEGEHIRDGILAAAGRLNPTIGGRPVRIPIEREIYDLIFTEGEPDNLWPVTPDESQHRRRSIYLLNKRTVRLPLLNNFDQPDTMTSCAVRPTSTHALQSLSLMNSGFIQAQSQAFADRLETDCASDRQCAINKAYRLTLARLPTARESRMAAEFLAGADARLSDFCLALLNRNEFVYRP